MKITLLCSCGLLLEHENSRILIDAPNGDFPPFYSLPEMALDTLKQGNLDGIFFTHLHSDHYDSARAPELLAAHPAITSFFPGQDAPQCASFTAGAFHVEAHRFAHTPAPQFPDLPHFVLLVTVGECSVYIAADAAPDVARHRAILRDLRPDAAFLNSQCLSYPEFRTLLREQTKQTFVYHMPIDAPDVSGIRRKCARNLARFGSEIPNVRVLTEYPTTLFI